jgi:hypothetical protein
MAAGGSSANIALGAGRLYVAAVGTTEPTDCSTAMPSAWRAVGYTEDGTTFSVDLSNEAIEVAEEYDPVRYVLASRATKLAVQMAEMTRRNLALSMGGGAAAANDATAFEPPDPGAEVAVMIVWDSLDTPSASNIRWLFRQCKVNGSVETQRNKAPNKALLPVEFNLEKPAGLAPFKVFPNSSGLV